MNEFGHKLVSIPGWAEENLASFLSTSKSGFQVDWAVKCIFVFGGDMPGEDERREASRGKFFTLLSGFSSLRLFTYITTKKLDLLFPMLLSTQC